MESKKELILPTANTLFRFLHLRSPGDEPQDAKTDHRYIDNGLKSMSVFLAAVEGLEDQEDIQVALQTAVDGFTPLKNAKEVAAVNAPLMKFSEWVTDPKSEVFSNELGDRLEGVSVLSDSDLASVWDNLYYLAITSGSEDTRDALICLLRGNNFIEVVTAYMAEHPEGDDPEKDGPTEEELLMGRNLQNASVLIPSVLVSQTRKAETETLVDLDPQQKKALAMLQETDLARFNIARYKKAIEEIRKAKSVFDTALSQAYTAALEAYNASVDVLVAAAPVSKETREPIVPELPKFVFETELEFNGAYLTDKVSEESRKLYLAAKKPTHKEPEETLLEMENDLTDEYERLLDNTVENITIKAYNGITLNVNNKPQEDSLAITAIRLYENEERYALLATHYSTNPDARLRRLDITISTGEETTETYAAKRAFNESDSHASYLLFPQGLTVNLADGLHTVSYSRTAVNPLYSWSKPSVPVLFPQYSSGREPDTEYDGIIGNDRVRLNGITQLNIAEYNRVEQEIYCYVAGEVSHIENIMAREYREKASRNLTRSEITTEETSEREVENMTDTTSTERHEMQQEVSKVLQEDQSLQIGASVGVSAKFSDVYSATANVNTNFSMSSSETNSFNQAESFAQEVTERAMNRIVEKTTYKRTSRMLREFEETNKHGFDNRKGDKHVTGVYRWVDKVYKNKLVNYGKRLMYDFMVPEPSKTFKYWMTKKVDTPSTTVLTEPKLLPELLGGYWGVDRYNYGRLAAEYGADVDTPPDYAIRIGKSFSESPAVMGKEVQSRISTGHNFKLEIPEGYQCENVRWSYSHFQPGSNVSHTNATLNISGEQVKVPQANGYRSNYPYGGTTVDRVEKELEISINTHQVGGFALNVLAFCMLKETAYDAWRNKTYMAIMEAYNQKLQAYKDALAGQPVPADPNAKMDYNFNPLIGRSIEQRELKRLCIEMMARPFGIYIGQNHYTPKTNENYKVKQTAALDRYAEQVRFFEEAFDWEVMSYMFFPYYWGEEIGWESLIKEQSSADFIFQAFLQSGMGKVTLPVKVGYERAVLYYFDTGKVWFGKGYTLDDGSLLYKKVLSALRVKESTEPGYVMSEWLTRVPSALTIIQSDSAPLNENGLPCFCVCEDGTPVVADPCHIAKGNNLMQGASDSGTSGSGTAKVYMEFPADSSLTAADIGKLVVNFDDKAKVSMTSPGDPAVKGIWKFFPYAVAAPQQAQYELAFTAQPAPGQTFSINATTFEFVDVTPTDPLQILIGVDTEETIANTVAVLESYDSLLIKEALAIDDAIAVTIGYILIGDGGNTVAFAQTLPEPLGTPLTWTLKVNGVNNDWYKLDNQLINFGTSILLLKDALNLSAPNGTAAAGYRWPATAYELAQNIQWALQQNSGFTSRFECLEVDIHTFRIQEINPPTSLPIMDFNSSMISMYGCDQYPKLQEPDMVKEVVLGVLEKLDAGVAYINPDRTFKVKLGPGVSITFSSSWPSDMENRILVAGDNGLAVVVDNAPKEIFQNGALFALEEGEAGDVIWVEKAPTVY